MTTVVKISSSKHLARKDYERPHKCRTLFDGLISTGHSGFFSYFCPSCSVILQQFQELVPVCDTFMSLLSLFSEQAGRWSDCGEFTAGRHRCHRYTNHGSTSHHRAELACLAGIPPNATCRTESTRCRLGITYHNLNSHTFPIPIHIHSWYIERVWCLPDWEGVTNFNAAGSATNFIWKPTSCLYDLYIIITPIKDITRYPLKLV